MSYLENTNKDHCPFCFRHINEILQAVPENKYITVDVPFDIIEGEMVMNKRELRWVIKWLNSKNSRVRLQITELMESFLDEKEEDKENPHYAKSGAHSGDHTYSDHNF